MVRVSGWPDGANAMSFITIAREFTAVSLADAKGYLDRLRAGETLDLRPQRPDQSDAFAGKLLRFGVVERAEAQDAETGAWRSASAGEASATIRAEVHGRIVEVSCYGSGSDRVCRLTDPSCQRGPHSDPYCPPPDLGFVWLRESHGMWLASGLVNREVFRDADTVDVGGRKGVRTLLA